MEKDNGEVGEDLRTTLLPREVKAVGKCSRLCVVNHLGIQILPR